MFSRSSIRHRIVETIRKENYALSRMSNGLRVLSCDDGNGITGMGLFTLNATKFEDESNFGAAAVLESLPLRGNQIMNSREISQSLGVLGNAFKVTNNKEAMSVMLMMPRYHRREGLELLNAMCLHPTQKEQDFLIAKHQAMERAAQADRDAVRVCFELIHEAAWNGKGLGNAINPAPEVLEKLSLETFTAFHKRYTRPERSVLAATGVHDHEDFAKEVEAALQFDCDDSPTPLVTPVFPYTGGSRLVQNTKAPESLNKFQEKNLSHIGLLFQGVPISHPDYYNVSVIQTLLGGGTSFSSGGPGKGMQTKLFREVLNREGWIHGLECITAWYSDGGLIGLYGSAPHEYVQHLIRVMVYQSASICERVEDRHLQMAKNQLNSQLVLLGEGREQLLSDLGFNMVVHNHITTAKEIAAGAEKITLDELKRVCRTMVSKPLTFAVYGETSNMLSHDRLEEHVRATYNKMNRE